MSEKRSKTIGILAALMMISTGLFTMIVPVSADGSIFTVTKKVWDPVNGIWTSDLISFDVGDTVRYNISIEYTRDYTLHSIRIMDVLPDCLLYNATLGATKFITPYGVSPDEIVDDQIIYWNFTPPSHELTLDKHNGTLSIEFEAKVMYCDAADNTIMVNAKESGVEIAPPGYANAEISINPLRFQKQVCKIGEIFSDHITAIPGDVLTFKFVVDYFGMNNITNMSILDILPGCLRYSNQTSPNPYINVSSDNITILVNFTDVILNTTMSHKEITFLVNVTASGPTILVNDATLNFTETPDNLTYDRTDNATITIIANHPPNTPSKPTGEIFVSRGYGLINTPYSITTSTTDLDGDQVQYGWDWNDDSAVDQWTIFYFSGETCSVLHSWSTAGIKIIRVKAKDIRGGESDWNQTLISILATDPAPHQPPLAPHKPDCNATGTVGEKLFFTTNTTDPDGPVIRYKWDWNDSSILEWIPEDPSVYLDNGENCTANHTFSESGTYYVRVLAMDLDFDQSSWSIPAAVVITSDIIVPPEDVSPSTPVLSGPSTGIVNKSYSFTAVSTDPGDLISYYFDFGDGTSSGWTTSYVSGATVSVSHSWAATGKGGLSVKATIINDGTLVANNINWSITVKSSRVLSKTLAAVNGTIDSLAIDSDIVVKTSLVKGFGKVIIKVSVDGASIESTSKTVNGFVFGFFIFVAK
ncbi:MAG: PKD domain-containing protein [Euryarchaeota archaeon]|nr:PKD domain-containing protein [Euryarchaeota archaeon]